jgi:asparagine synthase (glutamine-hydrolysing)
MCGIAGYLNLDHSPASPVVVQKMARILAHRGPDGEGIWIDGPLAFGHRRLAIIDLSRAAAQPMLSGDGNLALIYNGEIYNYRELRAELQASGHQFRSASDTEVILAAFAAWGRKALRRFNGMFAFALWNRCERRLLLVRDRYGIKPLYYLRTNNAIIFASESKAIFEHGHRDPELDPEALLEYMTFQNLFTERTLFKDVRTLPPGCSLEVNLIDGNYDFDRYWDYDFSEPENELSVEEYAEEVDRLFRQAVSRQLVGDVSVASYLSGGIDSGSITAVAAQQLPHIRSFTVGFDVRSASGLELQFDEREIAEHMSYLFGTEHYEMVLKAGDMVRCLPHMCWHLEEPRVGQSYPNYYASKLVSRFDKVVLAGTGGDELFAGYPWRYYRADASSDFDHYVDAYYSYWHRLIPNKAIKRVFAPIWPCVRHVWTRDIFNGVFGDRNRKPVSPADYINCSLYFEAKTFMHGLLLVEDKLSMAHGLETRVPFLDNDLVDFAMKIPAHLKLGDLRNVHHFNENDPGPKADRYFAQTKDGKLILRKVLSRYVPDEISRRIKQGFSAPDASWFRGDSIDYVRQTLCEGKPRIYDVFDRNAVTSLIEDHLQGRHNRRLLIWSLLSVEHWMRAYLN